MDTGRCSATRPGDRPRGASLPGLFRGRRLLAAAILGASLLAPAPECRSQATDAAANDLPATSDRVRCPDCDAQGRMPCPDCGGKGELERDCRICGGAGSRPCSVCTRENNAAGPGRIPCSFCGGRGTIGEGGRTCQRCQGQGGSTCITCLGKGTLSCIRKVPYQICPRCRFTRRVPCETCKGELSVPAALLAARAAQREKGAAEGARAATAGSAGATADSSAVKVDAAELERQWHGLSETHGQLLDLFAVDPRSELAPARTAAMQLLDRLHAAGAEDLAGEVAALLDRHQHLRRRWAELREQFEAESQTHATVENVLAGRREALAALPEHRRAQEMQRWNERLDLAIRIYQKNLQPLLDAEADWLGKERQAIDRLWEKLESQGAEAVAAAKAGGEEQKESGKENGRNDAKAAAAVSSNGAAAGAGPQGRTAGPPPKPASTPAAEKPKNGAPAPLPAAEPPHLAAAERNGGAGSTASGPPSKPPAVSARAQERLTPVKRDEPRPAARETEEASGPESRASPDDAGALVKLSPLLWALGGFAAASLVFLLLRRERRKTAVERDAAH